MTSHYGADSNDLNAPILVIPDDVELFTSVRAAERSRLIGIDYVLNQLIDIKPPGTVSMWPRGQSNRRKH